MVLLEDGTTKVCRYYPKILDGIQLLSKHIKEDIEMGRIEFLNDSDEIYEPFIIQEKLIDLFSSYNTIKDNKIAYSIIDIIKLNLGFILIYNIFDCCYEYRFDELKNYIGLHKDKYKEIIISDKFIFHKNDLMYILIHEMVHLLLTKYIANKSHTFYEEFICDYISITILSYFGINELNSRPSLIKKPLYEIIYNICDKCSNYNHMSRNFEKTSEYDYKIYHVIKEKLGLNIPTPKTMSLLKNKS